MGERARNSRDQGAMVGTGCTVTWWLLPYKGIIKSGGLRIKGVHGARMTKAWINPPDEEPSHWFKE